MVFIDVVVVVEEHKRLQHFNINYGLEDFIYDIVIEHYVFIDILKVIKNMN